MEITHSAEITLVQKTKFSLFAKTDLAVLSLDLVEIVVAVIFSLAKIL